MLNLALHCFAFYVWYAGPIDILRHSDNLLQDCKVLQDFIIDCMKDSLYWLTSDILGFPFTISPFYATGGVSFILVLQLWYGGMRVVYHDVQVFVLQEVADTMIKQTSLGHLKCWPLWAVDEKLISILAVVGHKVIFLDQAKGQDVSYSLGVILERIGISEEVTYFVGVCHS